MAADGEAADADVVTLEAGFTNDVTIAFDTDDNKGNKVIATTYTKSLTVTTTDATFDSGADHTITGGTGSDTLQITTAGNALIADNLEFVTKVETFKVATDAAASITLSDNNVVGTSASTETLTIDAMLR